MSDLESEPKRLTELPPETYVWINAYKRESGYYTPEVLDAFTAIDPLFPVNAVTHRSAGRAPPVGGRVSGRGGSRRAISI